MTVADIQRRLAELGHDPGGIDGQWGPKTMAAVATAIGAKILPPAAHDADTPPWLKLAYEQMGTREAAGAANSPAVLGYFTDAAHPEIRQDSVPWCAAFVGAMLKRAGLKPSGSLMARSYLEWGEPLDAPRIGCVVVLKRGVAPSGHVGFYVGGSVKILGGNQGDAVSIATFRRDSVLGFRWPADFN